MTEAEADALDIATIAEWAETSEQTVRRMIRALRSIGAAPPSTKEETPNERT